MWLQHVIWIVGLYFLTLPPPLFPHILSHLHITYDLVILDPIRVPIIIQLIILIHFQICSLFSVDPTISPVRWFHRGHMLVKHSYAHGFFNCINFICHLQVIIISFYSLIILIYLHLIIIYIKYLISISLVYISSFTPFTYSHFIFQDSSSVIYIYIFRRIYFIIHAFYHASNILYSQATQLIIWWLSHTLIHFMYFFVVTPFMTTYICQTHIQSYQTFNISTMHSLLTCISRHSQLGYFHLIHMSPQAILTTTDPTHIFYTDITTPHKPTHFYTLYLQVYLG